MARARGASELMQQWPIFPMFLLALLMHVRAMCNREAYRLSVDLLRGFVSLNRLLPKKLLPSNRTIHDIDWVAV